MIPGIIIHALFFYLFYGLVSSVIACWYLRKELLDTLTLSKAKGNTRKYPLWMFMLVFAFAIVAWPYLLVVAIVRKGKGKSKNRKDDEEEEDWTC